MIVFFKLSQMRDDDDSFINEALIMDLFLNSCKLGEVPRILELRACHKEVRRLTGATCEPAALLAVSETVYDSIIKL